MVSRENPARRAKTEAPTSMTTPPRPFTTPAHVQEDGERAKRAVLLLEINFYSSRSTLLVKMKNSGYH